MSSTIRVFPTDIVVVYDPIEPDIPESAICRHIFTRVYAEPIERERKGTRKTRALPSPDGTVAVFDVETIRHRLSYGGVEIFEKRHLKTRAVFYRDDLPTSDPSGFEKLKTICRELDVKLVSREWFFQYVIWPARKLGWIICGHHVTYDLAKVADEFEPATKTARHGTRFCNGFALKKTFTTLGG